MLQIMFRLVVQILKCQIMCLQLRYGMNDDRIKLIGESEKAIKKAEKDFQKQLDALKEQSNV